MTYTPPKLLTFEQFITEYGDNARYELIDGELRDMEPRRKLILINKSFNSERNLFFQGLLLSFTHLPKLHLLF